MSAFTGYVVMGPETEFVVTSKNEVERFLDALHLAGIIDDKDDYTANEISLEYHNNTLTSYNFIMHK